MKFLDIRTNVSQPSNFPHSVRSSKHTSKGSNSSASAFESRTQASQLEREKMQQDKDFDQRSTSSPTTSRNGDSLNPVSLSESAMSQPLERLAVPLVSAALPKPVPEAKKIPLEHAPWNPSELEPSEGSTSRHESLQAASPQTFDSSASQPAMVAALPEPEEAQASQGIPPDEPSVEPSIDNVARQIESSSDGVLPLSDKQKEVANTPSQTAHETRQEDALERKPQIMSDSTTMNSEPSPKTTSEEQPEPVLSSSDPALEAKTENAPGEQTENSLPMPSDNDTVGTNEVSADTATNTLPEEQPKAESENLPHKSQPEMIPEDRKVSLVQTTPPTRCESKAESVLGGSPETAFEPSSEVLPQEPTEASKTASEEGHRAVASSTIPETTEPQRDTVTDSLPHVEQSQTPDVPSVVPLLAQPNTEAGSHSGSPKIDAAPASITIPSVLPVTLGSKPVVTALPEGVIPVNGDENVPSSLPEVQDTQKSSLPLSAVSNTDMSQTSIPERPSSPSTNAHRPSVTKVQDSPTASVPNTATPEASSVPVPETAEIPKLEGSKIPDASSPTLPIAKVSDVPATDALKPAAHSPDSPVSEASEISQIKAQSPIAVDASQSAALPASVLPVTVVTQTLAEEAPIAAETEVQDAVDANLHESDLPPEPSLPNAEPQFIPSTRTSSPKLAGVPESAVSEVSDYPIVDIPSAFPVEVPSSSISEISRSQATVQPDQADVNTTETPVSEAPRLSTTGSPGVPVMESSGETSSNISQSTMGEISRQPSINLSDASATENPGVPITDLPKTCTSAQEVVVPQTEAAEVLGIENTEAPTPKVPEALSSSATEEPKLPVEEIIGAPEPLTPKMPDVSTEVISDNSGIRSPAESFPEVPTGPVLEDTPLPDVALPDANQVEDTGLPIKSSPIEISPVPSVNTPKMKPTEVPSLTVTKASETASDILDSDLPDTTAVPDPSVSVTGLAEETADTPIRDAPIVETPVNHGLPNTGSLQLPNSEMPAVLSLRAKRSKRRRAINAARKALIRKHMLVAVLGRELGETTHAEMKRVLELSKGVPM